MKILKQAFDIGNSALLFLVFIPMAMVVALVFALLSPFKFLFKVWVLNQP